MRSRERQRYRGHGRHAALVSRHPAAAGGQDHAALVRNIFTQVSQACRELGIVLVGGHTEITVGLERPILSGHMLGEVGRERLITSAGVQVGDALLLTKGFPVEGVSIIARERAHSSPPGSYCQRHRTLATIFI